MLIVGLGNPGKKYKDTRHNVGYMAIDELEEKKPDDFILAKTDTFMNLSGQAVKKLIADCRLQIADLLIVHDDIDLPIGQFKIQKGRGAAGHKGVQSIINALRTKDFWRVRVGICPKTGKPENVEKFVLQKSSKEERKILSEVIAKLISEIRKIGSPTSPISGGKSDSPNIRPY